MTAPYAIWLSILALVLGAVVVLLLSRHRGLAGWISFITTAGASGLILWAAGRVLLHAPEPAATFWAAQEYGFALRIYVDGLSAIFLILVVLVALPAVFYSIRYLDDYPEYGVGRYYPNLLLFLAGMVGLLVITDAMGFFFVFWQLMTLTSFALVRFEYRQAENRRAAWKYLALMQLACLLIMAGTELLATSSVTVGNETLAKYDFEALSHGLPKILQENNELVTAAFALFLAGFGIKAGMWPFGQLWLPDAHPAAPSPVSALLSGVMIKTGIYGLIRCFLWLIPAVSLHDYRLDTWGWLIAVLGTATLVIGTAQAMHQAQAKRLLAYSSIGQVGYILLGLGVCLALINSPLAAIAALALYGALFHVLNHGLFKGLLFLNAGSLLYATGTQNLNRLGGLMKYMPFTAVCTLAGVLSIAGAPLSSGFASKWCLYGAAIKGGKEAAFLPLCAVAAIFTSALTLAVFIRFFGASFLSRASALVVEKARQKKTLEVGWMMLAPKIWLAGLSVILGLAPALGVELLRLALHNSRQGLGVILADAYPLIGSGAAGLFNAEVQMALTPLAVAGTLGLLLMLTRTLAKLGSASRRAAAPWLCGYAREHEHNRYHARHFYGEIQRYLRWLGGWPKPTNVPAGKPANLT